MRPDIGAIADRAQAATKGPWAWRGYTGGSIELRTVGQGGKRIISTMRAEPCVVELLDESIALTYLACDSCKEEAKKTQDPWLDYRCPKRENLDTVWLQGDGFIQPANDWAVPEVSYRTDVDRVEHPDAAFIASARSDIPALLGYVNELEERLIEIQNPGIDMDRVRQIRG